MKTCYLIIAALLVGIVVGWLSASSIVERRHQDFWRQLQEVSEKSAFVNRTTQILTLFDQLVWLRSGETNIVIDLMERDLYSDVWLLALDSSKKALTEEQSRSILKSVASYRSQHPYKTTRYPEKDRLVEEFLAKASSGGEAPASVIQRSQSATN